MYTANRYKDSFLNQESNFTVYSLLIKNIFANTKESHLTRYDSMLMYLIYIQTKQLDFARKPICICEDIRQLGISEANVKLE